MREIVQNSRFRKDVKLLARQGKDLGKIKVVLELLVAGKELPLQYRDHALTGK